MNARGHIAAALGASFVILFFAQGWIQDVQRWVYGITGRTDARGVPADARKPDSGFAPGAGAGGRDAGGGGGGGSF